MTTTIDCEWCGEPFPRPHHRGPAPKYCSAAHRQASFRARHPDRPPQPEVWDADAVERWIDVMYQKVTYQSQLEPDWNLPKSLIATVVVDTVLAKENPVFKRAMESQATEDNNN